MPAFLTLNKHSVSRCVAFDQSARHLWFHATATVILAMMLCLISTAAKAQQNEPIFSYESPSDEMDFDLPPTPDLKSEAPPPPSEDPLNQVDRFFSDAPVLDEPEEPKAAVEEKKPEDIKEEKPKKVVRRAPPKPPYNFKTVVLPGTIYRKEYTPENRHLPVARYTSDMEQGVVGASIRGHIGSMRALKNIGTPMEVAADSGEPVITVAARMGDVNTVHWLLIQGVSADTASSGGLTALHYAAYRGSPEMVELLLSYGANANQTDEQGSTPMTYAMLSGNPYTVDVLRDFGAHEEAQLRQ